MGFKQTIVPNLWFDDQGEEAATFYVEVFSKRLGHENREESKILSISHYMGDAPGGKKAGDVLTVEFQLEGQRFVAINGGPQFTFSEAISFLVECEDQEEIDELWEGLVEGGGEHGPCGWLKDRYGLSWQIVPKGMDEMLGGPNAEGSARAFQAMMGMGKIEIAELQRAYEGA